MVGTDTYELKELAKLLGWNPAHCKVILKKLGADPAGEIDNRRLQPSARPIASTRPE